MKNLIQNNPIASFIIISFLYSWSLWILMILSVRHILPFYFPTNFSGSFGPAFGALIVSRVIGGKARIKAIFKSLIRMRSSVWAFLFSLFLIVIIYALTCGIIVLTDESLIKFQSLPGIKEVILYFFLIALIGGPLGEEIGWRGFLLPEYLKHHNPIITSLLIALIWFSWHLPLFWLEGSAQEGSSVLNFALSVLAMSILFTLLYLKSNGNLLQAILFHTVINYVSAFILPSILPFTETNKLFGTVFTIILIGTAIVFFLIFYKMFTTRKQIKNDDF